MGGCGRCSARSTLFGFHLAALDLRQNADVHEAVVGELLARAGVGRTTSGCPRPSASRCSRATSARLRLLHSPHLDYSERTRSELAILEAAARIHRHYGAAALPNYVISKCQSVSATCSRSACC